MATSHPFRSLQQLTGVAAPTLLLPETDDAHDPQISRWYAEHLPAANIGPNANVDASPGVAVAAFLQSLPEKTEVRGRTRP